MQTSEACPRRYSLPSRNNPHGKGLCARKDPGGDTGRGRPICVHDQRLRTKGVGNTVPLAHLSKPAAFAHRHSRVKEEAFDIIIQPIGELLWSDGAWTPGQDLQQAQCLLLKVGDRGESAQAVPPP